MVLYHHLEQQCSACHLKDDEQPNGHFSNMETTCFSCHENVHGTQFELEGITDCSRCHGFISWDASNFNHDNTAFKLEGRHAEIACEACHQKVEENQITFVKYKLEKFECIDCHQ